MTIHKAQGLTLDEVVIDVGKKASGLTFVACSCVHHLSGLLFYPPFPFQDLANLAKSQRLQERLQEDTQLLYKETATTQISVSPPTPHLFSVPSMTPSHDDREAMTLSPYLG